MRRLFAFVACVALALPGRTAAQSAPQAFFRSLLIPGWGQRYAGRPAAASWFLSAELLLWGSQLGLQRVADVRQDRYQSYAAVHAGARLQGKSSAFVDDLGFYASVMQHNLYATYDDGPAAALYPRTPEYFWEWDADASRQRYRQLRNAGERAKRQALYVTGLTAVNHLLAAVHAARSVAAVAPDVAGGDWESALQTGYCPDTGEARIALVKRF